MYSSGVSGSRSVLVDYPVQAATDVLDDAWQPLDRQDELLFTVSQHVHQSALQATFAVVGESTSPAFAWQTWDDFDPTPTFDADLLEFDWSLEQAVAAF